jgi:hypothetical protein
VRFLVDASFPRSVAGPQGDGHLIERYADAQTSDVGLILYAARELFDAVVFLGRSASAEPSLQSLVLRPGTPLIAFTATDDPQDAALYLRLRVEDVSEASLSKTAPALLIRKHDVQPMPRYTTNGA